MTNKMKIALIVLGMSLFASISQADWLPDPSPCCSCGCHCWDG